MAGLQPRLRRKQYDFRSFGMHRKAEIDAAWKLLQSFADQVGVFWSGLAWFLSVANSHSNIYNCNDNIITK